MRLKLLFFFCPIIICIGCVPKSTHELALTKIDSLMSENCRLIVENDELRNGESRLSDLIDYFILHGQYLNANKHIELLAKSHPQSQKLIAIGDTLQFIKDEAHKEQQIIDKTKADSIRLANIDELGLWNIGQYVDDFNRPTGRKYIYGEIDGSFSNTATSGRSLRVMFYTGKEGSMQMRLFEYGGSNPVKSSRTKRYTIIVTTLDNQRYEYKGLLGSDGDMEIHPDWSCKISLYELFKASTYYSFNIWETDNSTSRYSFKINPAYFENALLKAGIENL